MKKVIIPESNSDSISIDELSSNPSRYLVYVKASGKIVGFIRYDFEQDNYPWGFYSSMEEAFVEDYLYALVMEIKKRYKDIEVCAEVV